MSAELELVMGAHNALHETLNAILKGLGEGQTANREISAVNATAIAALQAHQSHHDDRHYATVRRMDLQDKRMDEERSTLEDHRRDPAPRGRALATDTAKVGGGGGVLAVGFFIGKLMGWW